MQVTILCATKGHLFPLVKYLKTVIPVLNSAIDQGQLHAPDVIWDRLDGCWASCRFSLTVIGSHCNSANASGNMEKHDDRYGKNIGDKVATVKPISLDMAKYPFIRRGKDPRILKKIKRKRDQDNRHHKLGQGQTKDV